MLAQAYAHAVQALIGDEQVAAAADDVPRSIGLATCLEHGDELVERRHGREEVDRATHPEGRVALIGSFGVQAFLVNCLGE